ncbi:MAG: ATPase [Clostridia bacterium]|nr:ATPase [Clostridia bacterium]
MDVYKILDEFEAEVEESAKIPLTNKAILPEEVLYNYIDQLRANLPEDIREAQWIKKERQRIIDEAEREAKKIIENAKMKVEELISQTEIVRLAEQHSQEIIKKAQLQAQEITEGAFSFADEIMSQLQIQLEKNLEIIREGRKSIQQIPDKQKVQKTG